MEPKSLGVDADAGDGATPELFGDGEEELTFGEGADADGQANCGKDLP